MSPQDAMFLAIEDDRNPMHIGNVSVFEGQPPTYGDFVRTVAAKLPLVPRYRQRVRFVPMDLGRPVWVDDAHFQILYHIRRTATPQPGSAEELRNLAGRVFAQNLDRGKPLWELWMVEGLEAGRWALISKVHHCMVDGVSGTDLLTVLLDREPQPAPAHPRDWLPAKEPSDLHLLADAAADAIQDPLNRVRGLPVVARAVFASGLGIANLTDVWNLVHSLRSWINPGVASLNGPIGPHRRWSWATASLAEVKEIRSALGGTVNDVVLCAITRGFRDLLLQRGVGVDGRIVRTLVPVSVRRDSEKGLYNNRVSGLFPGLPVGIDDPVECLNDIKKQMEVFKRSGQAVAGDVLTQLSGFAPPLLLALGARLAIRSEQRLVQTVTTNVPGPQFPLYAAGRQLLYAYPYVPIAGTVRIAIAIFSYLGALNFGLTGDYDSVPDLEILKRGIESGMTDLLVAARAQAEPAPAPAAGVKQPPVTRSRAKRPASRPAGPGPSEPSRARSRA
ncbi:MAG TPA: wax ester/triacylglycerol synthase family O-acyltransferase [Candidatus Dormibacteraeota bacterium]|nr:wax ester/triacylglycerol synthase family O-acyltransferase [Candidatus Dormibacteraeota bacterium]